jgi:tRNA (Thr-GGU) A37 N-methylase
MHHHSSNYIEKEFDKALMGIANFDNIFFLMWRKDTLSTKHTLTSSHNSDKNNQEKD